MKRVFLFIIFVLLISMTLSAYDLSLAGISAVGAAAGAYTGLLLSVPVLILLSNTGMIEEDIYSPFSTAMYDAMDFGSALGAIVGGITAKYTYITLRRVSWNFKNIAFDVITTSFVVMLSHITMDIIENYVDIPVFAENIIIIPALSGTYLGINVPVE